MTRFAALKADIDHELRNLKRLAKELDDILTATKERSIARTRAVGSLLHDFYTGVEKIFSQIAIKIDQDTCRRRLAYSTAQKDDNSNRRDPIICGKLIVEYCL